MTIETAVGLLALLRTGAILNVLAIVFVGPAWLLLGGSGRARRVGPTGVLVTLLVCDVVLLAGAILAHRWEQTAGASAPDSSAWLLWGSPIVGLAVFGALLVRDVRWRRRRRR